MNGNRSHGPASPRKVAILAEEEEKISFEWIVMKLIDESHGLRAGLDEIAALPGPVDLSAVLNLWSLQFTGLEVVALGHSDAAVRARVQAALAERRKAMNAILERVRKGNRYAEVWPVLSERKANGSH